MGADIIYMSGNNASLWLRENLTSGLKNNGSRDMLDSFWWRTSPKNYLHEGQITNAWYCQFVTTTNGDIEAKLKDQVSFGRVETSPRANDPTNWCRISSFLKIPSFLICFCPHPPSSQSISLNYHEFTISSTGDLMRTFSCLFALATQRIAPH